MEGVQKAHHKKKVCLPRQRQNAKAKSELHTHIHNAHTKQKVCVPYIWYKKKRERREKGGGNNVLVPR